MHGRIRLYLARLLLDGLNLTRLHVDGLHAICIIDSNTCSQSIMVYGLLVPNYLFMSCIHISVPYRLSLLTCEDDQRLCQPRTSDILCTMLPCYVML